MRNPLRGHLRRFATALGAVALAVTGLGAAVTAQAADLANIDTSATGSILIHKREAGSQGAQGTPDGSALTGGVPVADVVFTAYRITDLDLTTQAAWNGLADLVVPADACGADDRTPSLSGHDVAPDGRASAPTDNAGETSIDGLNVAAYLVCETSAPATVKTKAAPFLVTIPFPNNAANTAAPDGEWLYDVNVYPKNVVVEAPFKGVAVTANGLRTGAQISFPVTAKIPSIASTDSFKYFVVSDPLDSNLADGAVTSVKIDGNDVESSYYTVTSGQTVSVGFNAAGLAFLKTRPNAQIEVVFTARAVSVPASGVIENTAYLYVDTTPGDTPEEPPVTPPDEPGTPTNKVVTSWGDARVAKVDADNSRALQGATFQVYNAEEPYASSCENAVKVGEPIAVDGVTDFTSDADGLVYIPGLFVDQKAGVATDDSVVPEHTRRCYVLVETAAPAGYVLPANAETPMAITAGVTAGADYDLSVPNTKQNVPQLPLTGANGALLMMLLGAAFVLVGVGRAFATRSKRRISRD
ncbi:SpaH/EbpB family LPXTG-anchored major pilin [Actinomyces qiguomingii]|uniref:SpaH/EbpB family LPXTG-anchored major pilin n=1 Tax=Actinomyces qiguomingii TaxID=2057800 RepID=UPI000C9FFD2F|nr:SpaH/EbpB family LPXTG-anchored major pilin [Actinomyces qiguomingii]